MHKVTVTVPVLKDFTYRGRAIEAGESVTLEPAEAAAYGRSGHVSLSRVESRQMTAKATQPGSADGAGSRRRQSVDGTAVREPGSGRQRYQRRDLTAKDPE